MLNLYYLFCNDLGNCRITKDLYHQESGPETEPFGTPWKFDLSMEWN